MKLFLASFLEKDNFGPGRIISITSGSKPKNIDVSNIFLPFTPPLELIRQYNEISAEDKSKASDLFIKGYNQQLNNVVSELEYELELESKEVYFDLLPFQDGDTLCSWERKDYTNYRSILAPILEKMGYEVVLN